MSARWLPAVLGFLAAGLAAVYAYDCMTTELPAGRQVVFGTLLSGAWGWAATLAHALFFVWLSRTCFARMRAAPFAVIGYCVYLIMNVWIFTTGEGRQMFPNLQQMLITNSLLTGALLALCRVLLARREVFDR